MTERLIVTDARSSDVDPLVALEAAAFAADRISRRSFRRLIPAATACCRVAWKNSRIAGYHIVLFRQNTTIARLYSIAVHPDQRGAGVAGRLLDDAEDRARSRRRATLRLEVREDNRDAIRLYQRRGYRRIGTYRDYYADGASAFRLEKRLSKE